MPPHDRLSLIGALANSAGATEHPNAVIFLADDAGWGDYSRNGNAQVQTPNIDSLARDGVTLDRFFVCPLCSLTRAEFLTGRYYPRGGVCGVSTGQERLNLDERTVVGTRARSADIARVEDSRSNCHGHPPCDADTDRLNDSPRLRFR